MQKNRRRVHAIDGIRGISLLGILLANLLIFQYGIWGKDELALFNVSLLDEWMYGFTKIAIEGSFMPIFTFLFGYSMMMMRDSLERRGLRIKWHFFRRSVVLLVIGLLHATFLWEGDILFVYGMMGVFLLVFLNRKVKTILIWGISLFLLFGIINSIPEGEDELVNQEEMTSYVEQTNQIYGTGSYSAIKDHRNNGEDPLMMGMGDGEILMIFILIPFTLAPMFLFGMYAAKRKVFFHPEKEKRLYWFMAIFGASIGVAMKSYGFFFHQEGIATIGGMILSFGYIGALGVIYSKGLFVRVLHCFESVGKLSLTNYMLQTVICTFIFYGYGFGLFGKIGVGWATLLGLLIYGMQMAFSSLYVEKFRYGPLEKILRVGTYLTFKRSTKPFKKEAA